MGTLFETFPSSLDAFPDAVVEVDGLCVELPLIVAVAVEVLDAVEAVLEIVDETAAVVLETIPRTFALCQENMVALSPSSQNVDTSPPHHQRSPSPHSNRLAHSHGDWPDAIHSCGQSTVFHVESVQAPRYVVPAYSSEF